MSRASIRLMVNLIQGGVEVRLSPESGVGKPIQEKAEASLSTPESGGKAQGLPSPTEEEGCILAWRERPSATFSTPNAALGLRRPGYMLDICQ